MPRSASRCTDAAPCGLRRWDGAWPGGLGMGDFRQPRNLGLCHTLVASVTKKLNRHNKSGSSHSLRPACVNCLVETAKLVLQKYLAQSDAGPCWTGFRARLQMGGTS